MRVVVTGVGVVSAIGSGAQFGHALERGTAGIGELTTFDPGDTLSVLAAEIPQFVIEEYLESAKTYLDRASGFLLAVGALALRDAAFAVASPAPGPEGFQGEPGLSFGTAYGCLETMGTFWGGVLEKGPRLASSLLFTHSYANTPVSLAAIEFRFTGPHHCFCSGAASAGYALANAALQLQMGRAPAVLAGGGEALSPYLYAAYAAAGALSPGAGGTEGLRPFAATRNGTVLGEGAGALLLETEAAARARGAQPQALLLGHGCSALPGADGARAAMAQALAAAGQEPGTVDAVFASASGLPEGDAWEATALESLFGGRRVPVVALKAAVGETLGAGGALAAAAAVHALRTGTLPGVPGTEAPEFPLHLVGAPETAAVRQVLVNAFDAAAGCVSLLFGAA